MIFVENKRKSKKNIEKEHPGAVVLDVTSKTPYHSLQILSPFYPHGNIPVPFSDGVKATCVEAIWQGLKVFKSCGIDTNMFNNSTMKNLKRTVRKYGKPLGHQKGVYSKELLSYLDARMQIYIPTYKWVLDNVPEVHHSIERIKEESKKRDIVFLDYNTNMDYTNTSSPLSHAGLIKLYIEDNYPDVTSFPKRDGKNSDYKNISIIKGTTNLFAPTDSLNSFGEFQQKIESIYKKHVRPYISDNTKEKKIREGLISTLDEYKGIKDPMHFFTMLKKKDFWKRKNSLAHKLFDSYFIKEFINSHE